MSEQQSHIDLKKSAEQGDIDAQKSLADCYFYGYGVEKDYVQAVKCLEILLTDKELDWDDIQIGWQLVDCYSEGGHGLEPNYSKAEEWSKKIVETNNKYWHWDRLRDFYFKGTKEFEPNPIKGFEWLKKWAEKGYVRAQNELAECYFQGIGIEKNTDKAIEWLKKSAEQGYAKAQNRLAECYFQGIDIEKNTDKAIEWLKKAAEDGTCLDNQSDIGRDRVYRNWGIVTEARRQLAFRYFFGKEVNQDYMEALNWFKSYKKINQGRNLDGLMTVELAIFTFFARYTKESIEIFESCNNGYSKLWLAYFYYLTNKSDIEKISNKDACDPYSASYEGEDKGELGNKEYGRLLDIQYWFDKYLENAASGIFYENLVISGDTFDIIFHKKIIDFLEIKKNNYSKVILAFYYQYKNDGAKYIELLSESYSLIAKYKLGLYYKKLGDTVKAKENFEKITQDECVEALFCNEYEKIAALAKKEITKLEYEEKLEIKNQELEEKNKQLEEKIKHLEDAQNRLKDLVQNTSHLAGNLLRPNTQEKIAKKLKNSEFSEESKKLYYASSDIKYVKQQFKLLEIMQSLTGSEAIINQIKLDQVDKYNNQAISIEDVLNLAAFRAIDKLFDSNEYSLNFARETIEKKQGNFSSLSNEYHKYILKTDNSDNLSIISWCSENLRPITINYQCDDWKKLLFYNNSQSVALFFCYFFELFFNAFKYADHNAHNFLTITLANEFIDDNEFLTMIWTNPKSDKTTSFGSNKGLNLSASYISLLNDDKYKDKSQELLANSDNVFELITRIDRKNFSL